MANDERLVDSKKLVKVKGQTSALVSELPVVTPEGQSYANAPQMVDKLAEVLKTGKTFRGHWDKNKGEFVSDKK